MRWLAALTLLLSLATGVTEASAQQVSHPPDEAHQAVMWRLSVGGAYVHGWSRADDQSRTVSGFPSGTFSAALGHTIADGLVLHMDILAARSGGATYSSEGMTVADDVDLTAVLLGIGATYWIAPYDVFITGGLGLGQISTVSGAFRVTVEIIDIESTDVGVGLHAGIGKQWRVSPKWGIGPMFQLWFLTAPQEVANHLKLMVMNLALSITFD